MALYKEYLKKKKALVSWRRYTELRKPILWQGSVIKYNNHKSTRSQRDKGGVEEEEGRGQLTEKAEASWPWLGWIS